MSVFSRVMSKDFIVVGGVFAKAGAVVSTWKSRAACRRELAELSFRDLMDAGLDQVEVDREIAKPFWVA